MKRMVSLFCMTAMLCALLAGCGGSGETPAGSGSAVSESGEGGSAGSLNIYNWGEYFDLDAIEQFEQETGIEVAYDEYETNEAMYPIIAKGAAEYDLICPSDYMVQRMKEEGLLEEINWDNVPNRKYIDEQYWEYARSFDEENKYSVPYLWGTVGILYNTAMVQEPIDSWAVLWDERYKDNVLMQKSVRDAFGITLKYLGYSLNSTDINEIERAKQELFKQKQRGIVQAYVVDEVRDKMIAGEAAIGVIYSGEALTCQQQNPDLKYVIPKEGSELWMDCFAIPKGAKNKENAEKFLDFLCRPEIMKKNFDYITYSIPSSAGQALIEEEEYRSSEIAFPALDSLTNCETLKYLGKMWTRFIMTSGKSSLTTMLTAKMTLRVSMTPLIWVLCRASRGIRRSLQK